MQSFFATVLLCLCPAVQSLVLSKSQIKTCDRTGAEKNCSELLYVQLSLQSGQGFGEELSFNVSKFQDQDGNDVTLGAPLEVSLMKSNVEVSYNTLYRQDVNTNPVEKIVDSNYLSCSEGLYLGSLQLSSSTCTVARDASGNVIQNSQGYCCGCPLITYLGGIRPGGTTRSDCGFLSNSMSASCLNFPNQWHSLYEVTTYQYNYFVTARVKITRITGMEQENDLVVSNSQKSANNGILQLSIVGDFAPTNPPPDLTSKFLLRPRVPTAESTPSANWLLVDRQMVTTDGSECNKIGVGYSAFQNQANKCQQRAGSCTGNQIMALIATDTQRKAQGLPALYQLDRFGTFSATQSSTGGFKLNSVLASDMPTLVQLVVNSTDLVYTLNVGKGNITAVQIVEFEGMTSIGQLNVSITSTSLMTANFEVALNCTSDIRQVSSRSISLPAVGNTTVVFSIYTSTQLRANHSCLVRLLNAKGSVVDTRAVEFATVETTISLPQTAGMNQTGGTVQYSDPTSATSVYSCDSVCPGQFSLGCRMTVNCPLTTSLILLFLLLVLAALLGVSCCCCPSSTIGCMKKMLCLAPKQNRFAETLNADQTDLIQNAPQTRSRPNCILSVLKSILCLACCVVSGVCSMCFGSRKNKSGLAGARPHPSKQPRGPNTASVGAQPVDDGIQSHEDLEVGTRYAPPESESSYTQPQGQAYLNFTNKCVLGRQFRSRFHCVCSFTAPTSKTGRSLYVPEKEFCRLFADVGPEKLVEYISAEVLSNRILITTDQPLYPVRINRLLLVH